MSREGKLAKNTVILAIGTFFPKLAVFITLPVLTAYMTKSEYGTYDLVLTLVSLVLPAATLQIQSAAFRFLIDKRHDEKERKSIISNIYAFIIPTSIIALCIMFVLLKNQLISIRIGICTYFLFDIISNANKQIIRGLSQNISYAISAFISAVGQILFIVCLVWKLKMGLLGGITSLCVAEFLSGGYLLIKGKIYKYLDLREVKKAKLKELISYSWPMVPNSLSQWVMHVSDRLVITAFMGVAANAVYAVAYKIPSILSFAQTTFNMAWQENASIVSKDEDVAKYYSSMFSFLFDIVAGGMAILIGITPYLFKILINSSYVEAYNQIPILYMGIFFFCLSSFWGGIYIAYKKTKGVGLTTVAAAACNLIIDLVSIKFIGLYAASISTLVSYILLCAFRMIGIKKIISLTYNHKHIIWVLSILLIECIISFQQNMVLNIVNFVIGLIVCISLNYKFIPIFYKKMVAIGKSN